MNAPAPSAGPAKNPRRLRVVAVGGAAGRIAQRLALQWRWGALTALDSDQSALEALNALAPACATHQIAPALLHGMGTGGDPENARNAADAEVEALRRLVAGAEVVFLIAALGRGVGSGVAPLIARLAKEAGALVLAFAVHPFPMEGRRAGEQAAAAARELRQHADAVINLSNADLIPLASGAASLADAFGAANQLLCDALAGIARMTEGRGLMTASIADIRGIVRGPATECVLASASSTGEHRAADAVGKLLAHPFLKRGVALEGASGILVSVTGGPELGLADVAAVMEPVNLRSGGAPVIVGAQLDDALGGQLSVVLIASREVEAPQAAAPAAPPATSRAVPVEAPASGLLETPPPGEPAAPQPRAGAKAARRVGTVPVGRAAARRGRFTQEQLPLDSVSRGRFEQSEPTIHHGEDLDTPTFIRRGVVLN